ncbi:MAG: hypothetical protein GH151_11305 [Bacteroidetes bacterium]|nr:hypothetical protein [Bacteroidota bacterium]
MNDEGKIVGCTLYFPTKARITGKGEKIFWGHDMIVEEHYRGAAGLLLIIEMCNNKSAFGFGTTDINLKIQKELGTKFIGVAKHYLIFNFWSYKLLLLKLKLIGTTEPYKYNFPDKLKVGKYTFNRISSVNELNIPTNGYWSDSSLDIDFVRDEHFLRNRFFENFTKYYFYSLELDNSSKTDECYFVVRPAIESGFLVLSIVDFRFNFKKYEQYKLILKAAARLGRRNRFPLVSLRTSVEYRRFNLYPLIFRTDSQDHIVTNFPVDTNLNLFVTNADSDSDFLTL